MFKDIVEVQHADVPPDVLEQALPIIERPEPILIAFVFGIKAKEVQRVLDFRDVGTTESKLLGDIVFIFSSSKSSAF